MEAGQESQNGNSPMFDRLGHIVRQLHDSLRELGYDRSLSDIATEVTDATDRLDEMRRNAQGDQLDRGRLSRAARFRVAVTR